MENVVSQILLIILTMLFSVTGSLNYPYPSAPNQQNNETKEIKFFTKRLVLQQPLVPIEPLINSRFSLKPSQYDQYNLKLLQLCTDFNLNYPEDYEIFDEENENSCSSEEKLNPKSIFVSELETILNNLSGELEEIEFKNSLNHFQCFHAIENCGLKYLGNQLIIKLIMTNPEVMKNHLRLVCLIDDLSFLTIELALILFKDRIDYFSPFSIDRFVKSFKLEVLVALLELWEYEFCAKDVKIVLDNWGDNQEFLDIIEKDPRSWLLWIKSDKFKPFPIESFLEIDNLGKEISKYANLLMALVHRIECFIFDNLCDLEYIYATLDKTNKEDGKISPLDLIHTCDLWFETGQNHIQAINDQFNLKKRITDKLIELQSSSIDKKLILYLVILFKIPLVSFSHRTFNYSHDYAKLISAALNHDISSYYNFLNPELLPWNEDMDQFWTMMWYELNNHGDFENSYDEILSYDFSKPGMMLDLLTRINFRLKSSLNRHAHWHVLLTIMILNPTTDINESDLYLKSLISFIDLNNCGLGSKHFDFFRLVLAPESISRLLKYVAIERDEIKLFYSAPEALTRDQIFLIITNITMRDTFKKEFDRVSKFRFLTDFNTEDLLRFFPLGSDFHLEFHNALYTVDPTALVGYLHEIQGALNYPEKFVLSVHPYAWNNQNFVDLMAENIPFSLFFKYPNEIYFMNLEFSICDIIGRISRSDMQMLTIKKLVLKWTILMEWIYTQFLTVKVLDQDQDKLNEIERIYLNFAANEKSARVALVTWFRSGVILDNDIEMLAKKINLPLSGKRLAWYYDIFINGNLTTDNTEADYICDILNQFSVNYPSTFFKSDIRCRHFVKLKHKLTNYAKISFELIAKYFDSIEKIVWRNRLCIVALGADSFNFNSKNPEFDPNSLQNAKVPIHDIQVAFNFFTHNRSYYFVLKDYFFEFSYSLTDDKLILKKKLQFIKK